MKYPYDRNYYRVHQWLRWNFVKNNKCDHCGSASKLKYEWALIKGKKYEKKRENFAELCISCHRIYDGLMEALAVRKYKPVVAYTGTEQLYFSSIKEATEALDILPSSISNSLSGRSKTAGNYRWQYV